MEYLTQRAVLKRSFSKGGFTLLEMIGVLAIMGILAAVITPNVVNSIERATLKAEAQNLAAIGKGLRSYLIENRALPAVSTWASSLSEYTNENADAIAYNSRELPRTLVFDPASSPSKRAILISSMRPGLSIPSASQINTANRFASLWNEPDGEIPSTASWSGWSAWNSVHEGEDYLVIERVNLNPIYLDELKTSSIAINNTTSGITSYEVEDSAGTPLASAPVSAGASILLNNLARGDRVYLYSDSAYSSLIYTYIVCGEDRSFDYSTWLSTSP